MFSAELTRKLVSIAEKVLSSAEEDDCKCCKFRKLEDE